MVKRPLVSVLMAVHNGGEYLKPAIDSVLAQTLGDFEFVIVEDCSTDDSFFVLASYGDSRLRIVRNDQNLGLTKSLNVGLELARGRYVARMDADDICVENRLERQVRHLESGGISLTCSNVFQIDAAGNQTGQTFRAYDRASILWHLMFDGYMFHPTLMWNREEVKDSVGGYDERFVTAQDFDFTWRVATALPVGGLEEPLLYYRMHGENITSKKRSSQRELALGESKKRIREMLGPNFLTDYELDLLRKVWSWELSEEWEEERFEELVGYYLQLWRNFLEKHRQTAWEVRSAGLKLSSGDDAAKLSAYYLVRKNMGGFWKMSKVTTGQLGIPNRFFLEALQRRLQARKARTNS